MSRAARSFGMALVVCFTALSLLAQDEPRPPAPPFSLPVAARYASHLEVAYDRADKKDWYVVATLLQKLLDLDEDGIAEVRRPDGEGKETVVLVNVRAEAERVLGSLPAEGRAFYQREYGGQAEKLVKEARGLGDPHALLEIARRYFHTEAGADAVARLGLHHLDRGHLEVSATWFRRLLDRPGADRLPAATLFQTALALKKAGDNDGSARAVKLLGEFAPEDGFEVGSRKLTVADAKTEIEKTKAPAATPSGDWPLFRGDPSRSARGPGGAPSVHPAWSVPLTGEKPVKDRIDLTLQILDKEKHPLLHELHPLVLTAPTRDGMVPLAVYRSWSGIHAIELRSGEVFWEAPSLGGLARLTEDPRHAQYLTRVWNDYVTQRLRPALLFENSTLGTLSSDGQRVYAIDDLPMPLGLSREAMVNFRFFMPGDRLVNYNLLQAYELSSGKILWEVGGSGEKEGKKPLRDSFFLGPPLPLAGQLWCLAETKGELALVALELKTGKLISRKVLGKVGSPLPHGAMRRVWAANLTSANGLLLCSTGTGTVVAYDPLTSSLAWVFDARAAGEPAPPKSDPRFNPPPPGLYFDDKGRLMLEEGDAPTWFAASPVVAGDRALLALPAGKMLYCVRLKDGQLLWKQPRKADDLYVAGAADNKALVVGRKTCRALNLKNGEQVWSLETGEPSGVGALTGDHLCLPLRSTPASKVPEFCMIDVAKGQVISHVRFRDGKGPAGNLAFTESGVVSQALDGVTFFPSLEYHLKRIDELLKRSPNDPDALHQRGQLHKSQGDPLSAAKDFRAALGNKPPAALRDRLRTDLFATLVELCQRDFHKGEAFLPELDGLSRADFPEANTPQEVKARDAAKLKRRTTYLMLVATGREKQGDGLATLKAYLDLTEIAIEGELMPAPEDPTRQVTPAVWARGRIADLMKKATEEERKKIEQELGEQLKKARSEKGVDALRRLVALLDATTAVGREARLQFALRLTEPADFLEAELSLLTVRTQRGDSERAARAIDLLAQLCARRGLFADVVGYYRELNRDYPKTVVRDGKTGAQLFEDLATDKRLLPYLQEKEVSWPLKWRVKEEKGVFGRWIHHCPVPVNGDPAPFFARHELLAQIDSNELHVRDRASGDNRMTFTVTGSEFRHLLYRLHAEQPWRATADAVGHLIVLPAGARLHAFDLVGKTPLWHRDLVAETTPELLRSAQYKPSRYGMILTYDGQWRQRVNAGDLSTPEVVCLLGREGIIAVEPRTGRPLWTRPDVPADAELFRDDRHLFVLTFEGEDKPKSSMVLRLGDGTKVDGPDFTEILTNRHQVFGGTVVHFDKGDGGKGDGGKVILIHRDLASGKVLMAKTFPAGSLFLRGASPSLAGVVEPDGQVTAFDLQSGKPAFSAKVDRTHLDAVRDATLIRDGAVFHLALSKRVDSEREVVGEVYSNLSIGVGGERTLLVNGHLYSFQAEGKVRWFSELHYQRLLLDRMEEMPVLVLSSRYSKYGPNGEIEVVAPRTPTTIIDKRTGKLLYDRDERDSNSWYGVRLDPVRGVIELTASNRKLLLEAAEK